MTAEDHIDLGIPGVGPGVLIGSGGTARVYRARQESLDRTVAVKILTHLDEAGLRRFDRERRAMGRLSSHPGILTVYEAGVNSLGESYVISPLINRGSLQDIVDQRPMPWAEAAITIARVADTIADAHDEGVLHRDLKPANVLVGDRGEPLVADFGLAYIVDSATVANRSTQLAFTPGYVPPETLEGVPASAAGDVYSLGATFFALVAGRAPFVSESADSNILALALRIRDEPVPDLRPHGIPDPVCQVLERAMAKEPGGRPTARQLASTLRSVHDQFAGGAPPPAPSTVTGAHPPEAGPPAGPVGAHESEPGAPPPPHTTEPSAIPPLPPPLPSAPPPTGRVPQTDPAVGPAAQRPIDGFVQPPRSRGGGTPVLQVAGGFLAVLALVAGGWFLFGRDTGEGTADPPGADGTDAGTDDAEDAGDTGTDGADDTGTGDADDAGSDGPTQALAPAVVGEMATGVDPTFRLAAGGYLWLVDVRGRRLARIDVDTGEEATVAIGSRAGLPMFAFDRVWIPNRDDGTLSVIDPVAMTILATVPIGNGVGTPVEASGRLFVPLNNATPALAVVDPETLTVDPATLPVGPDPGLPVVFADQIWIPSRGADTLTVIDPVGLTVLDTVVTGDRPLSPAVLFDRLWISNEGDDTVTVVNPGALFIGRRIDLGATPRPAVAAGGLVWVATARSDRIVAIDPDSDPLEIVHEVDLPPGSDPRLPLGAFDAVWVTLGATGEVAVIDPDRGEIVARLPVGAEPARAEEIGGVVVVPSVVDRTVTVIAPFG